MIELELKKLLMDNESLIIENQKLRETIKQLQKKILELESGKK